MSNLQKVAFGVASDGSQGDTTRAAFTKDNANVDILNAQATLTSFATTITTASALTAAAHLGKRVNINLASPGTINLPAAASCGADGIIQLRNLGATLVTLAIAPSSGDVVALTTLAAGESADMDTDGGHYWGCALRGRTSSPNEVVQGNCTINGNETVVGALTTYGQSTLGNVTAQGNLSVGATLSVTGPATFATRPTVAGKVPWDTGNLPVPVFGQSTHSLTMFFSGSNTIGITVDSTTFGLATSNNQLALNWNGSAIAALVNGTSVGTLAFTSDYRVKSIVSRITGSLDRVLQLQPTKYKFINFGIFSASDRENSGFIAHEVQAIIPSAVEGVKDGVDAQGNPQFQSLNPLPLISELTAALQESHAMLIALTARVTALEAKATPAL
jgi:hypothetical protein